MSRVGQGRPGPVVFRTQAVEDLWQPSQEEVEGFVRFYARWLYLQDWNITIRYVEKCDFQVDSKALAECWQIIPTKTARISLRKVEDFNPKKGSYYDVEANIVHELVHLHYGCISTEDTGYTTMFEQGIECTAKAIVGLARAAFPNRQERMLNEDGTPGI